MPTPTLIIIDEPASVINSSNTPKMISVFVDGGFSIVLRAVPAPILPHHGGLAPDHAVSIDPPLIHPNHIEQPDAGKAVYGAFCCSTNDELDQRHNWPPNQTRGGR